MSLHLHMPATRLDKLTTAIVLGFFVFVIITVAKPSQVLAEERDELRTTHVRELMSALLQLRTVDPQTFDHLTQQVHAAGDLRVMLGAGDCVGSHGRECLDAMTSDVCLPLRDYVSEELLPAVPIDPIRDHFSEDMPGYYLSVFHDKLEVGSCAPTRRPIFLRISTQTVPLPPVVEEISPDEVGPEEVSPVAPVAAETSP